ncbi:pimeloyl-ACP methyl ester carboxylesterase [Motilibacter rhizosphaerae]|uniref:Pimeloyl-ACP methyl ester carboxylesterase n=1 Tax=Motilibacter rhizosphaerae TaxID=598652 RepID=A0A4Q7NXI0_9ACTN|nr:alpha/beta hydrolase [Motilibacter rhizosphaerae]RZS91618.1 pimeloyl-ACP methyl ester carboxylesterase [Motilibacter rhizosphaerae]
MTTTPEYQIPVYDHRPGAGPTLVLLHYWGGSARTWDPVVDRLPGRSTLTIDARGWGRSRDLPGPYDLEQLAEDTRRVVETVGLDDYVLVGHSMGGKVAQLVAAARPAGLRGLVLVAPAPAEPPAHVTPDYQDALSHAYDSADAVEGALGAVLTAAPLPAQVVAQVVEDSVASTPQARAEWPLHGIASDITAQTQRIGVPVLVLAGERDEVEPPHVLADHLVPYLADVELVVVPGSGHLLPLEAPVEVAARLAAFTAVAA